jgi:DNA-binding IclR family transcriptional regulator
MANAPNAQELIDLSAPVMKRLTTQTQESSYLAVPGPAGTCTFLREVQSPLPLRYVGFDGWEGRTVPMAGSVTGEVLGQRVPAEGYVVMATVTDPDSTAIGAPVRLENGSIIAVLSLAGPSFRLTEDSVRRHGEAIKAAAAELGAALK